MRAVDPPGILHQVISSADARGSRKVEPGFLFENYEDTGTGPESRTRRLSRPV